MAIGGIGHLHMQGVLVGLGIDGDRLDPHFARGLDDPAGDLAAIGDQDALEHAGLSVPTAAGLATLRQRSEKGNARSGRAAAAACRLI